MQRQLSRGLVAMAGLVFGLLMMVSAVPVHADTGGINPAKVVVPTGFRAEPQANEYGGNAQWKAALSTSATSSTSSSQYAVVRPGQSVNVYGNFNYTGLGWDIRYNTAVSVGTGAVKNSSEATSQGGANIAGYVTAINGSASVNNIGYTVTAPSSITTPTWMYFQISPRGWSAGLGNYIGSSVFKILILPANYQMSSTIAPEFVFRGGTITSTSTTSPIDGVTNTSTFANTSGAGTWGTATATSNTFTAIAAGSATATYQFPVSVPYPAGTATPATILTTQTAYIGNIADQSSFTGSDVSFNIDLPAGLTASNIVWKVNGETQSSTDTTLNLADLGSSQNGATVTATMDVSGNGISVTGVTGSAKLTVVDSPFNVTGSSHLVFSGDGVPLAPPSNTAKMSGEIMQDGYPTPVSGDKIAWSLSDPSLGTIDSAGLFTANTEGKTGTESIVGTYVIDGRTVTSAVTIQVARLAQPDPVMAGQSVTLTAPESPTGAEWHYMWLHTLAGGGVLPIENNSNTYTTGELSATNNGDQYQVIITQTDIKDDTNTSPTVWSNPVTITVGNPVTTVSLDETPDFFHFYHDTSGQATTAADLLQSAYPNDTVDNSEQSVTGPSVAQLINGQFSGTTTDFSQPQALLQQWLRSTKSSDLKVSSNRLAPEYQVTAQLAPFTQTSTGEALHDSDGNNQLLMYWADASANNGIGQLTIRDDNVATPVLTNEPMSETYNFSRTMGALLAPGKVAAKRALIGNYSSTIDWTLTKGPQ